MAGAFGEFATGIGNTDAGFVFEGESKVLRNPADDLKKLVFDKTIRGHTDQFIYKFRKPKK